MRPLIAPSVHHYFFAGGLDTGAIILSLCGTVLCGWNLIQTFQSPLTLLGVLSSAIQFLSYLALLVFALYKNKLKLRQKILKMDVFICK